MLLSGYGSLLTGTCQYATGFVGNAQCRVANDTNNPVCRQPVSINAGMCRSLDALDGTLIILDDNNEASARFRCRTQDNVEAQNITIDCGNGDTYTENNVSSLTHRCDYDENADDIPVERTVRCTVDG